MKIITDLICLKDIDKLNGSDYVIISTKYSYFYEYAFDKEDIILALNKLKENKIKPIIKIDKIIDENEIEEVHNFIDMFINYDTDFMFSDMAVYNYFINKNYEINRLIYNAPTYICNIEECKHYKLENIRVMLSNELALDDVIKCAKEDNVIIQTFGYYPIYYSKRKVINLYKEHANKDIDPLSKKYKIVEETRKESYHIVEYYDHSIITSANRILIFNELDKVIPN